MGKVARHENLRHARVHAEGKVSDCALRSRRALSARLMTSPTCVYRKLDSAILVVKAAENRV